MTKDEMKNRISMALKDPTLQQGFEIICKHLANLEKQNKELQKEIEYLKKNKTNLENKYINTAYQLEGRELVINELTQQIEKMRCCGNCIGQSFRMLYCPKCTNKSEWKPF